MSMSVWGKGQCGIPAGRVVRRGCTFFVPSAKCQARVLECQALDLKTFWVLGWGFWATLLTPNQKEDR